MADALIVFRGRFLACSPPVFHIAVGGIHATPGAKIQAAQLCWRLVTIHLPLDHIPEVFNGVQILRLSSPWQGPNLVVLHLHIDWPGCVAWNIVLLEKLILSVGGHFQSRWKQVLYQDILVSGLFHASFTKANVPDSSFAEAPPDHHPSSTKLNTVICRLLPGHCLIIRQTGVGQSWKLDSSEKTTFNPFSVFCKPQPCSALVLIDVMFI